MTRVTTHDITTDDGDFILEWIHTDNGTDYITLTQCCPDNITTDDEECDEHENYDFMQTDDGKTANVAEVK